MKGSYIPPQENINPLEKYTFNLTERAKSGKLDPVIGRDNEIRRVMQILSRRTKNNPVLLGDPGVGKTAIVEGLAQRIVAGDVPDTLKLKQILMLDLAGILAGASYRGEFEQRLKSILETIEKDRDKYILFMDELHTLVGAGAAEGAVDAGNMLKPALARGALRMIGATTVREYRQRIEKDPALERRFQPILVDEPTQEDTLAILRGIKEKYEVHHGIKISDDALISAVNLSTRYITDRFLPDKAIDLIDEAAASSKIEIESMPTELDQIKRQIIRFDIELAALKKEKDSTVQARKVLLEDQRKRLKLKFDNLHKKWQEQKQVLGQLQKYIVQLDQLKADLEKAEREVLLDQAAELKYGKIPEVEKKVKELQLQWKKIPQEERLLKEEVTEDDIAQIVARWTGIPVARLLSTESERLIHLENELKAQVVGQDYALHKIANAVLRSRAGLSEENRPIGSFLLLGPTGVGKTETAKALAYTLFNDKKAMIRFDMSEYQEAHTVARLIGAPPGYIGFDEGGQLTEAVRRKPYSVVLFDEVEKAHSQIFNIFLQILDEGRLTDSRGRVVNFKNTVIILTSNLGSDVFQQSLKEQELAKEVMSRVKKFFKPEFINRLDSIVIFNALDELMITKIVDLQLQEVILRLKKQYLDFEVTELLKRHLRQVGFDPIYGARPLKRIINELIIDEIALEVIENNIKPGDKIIANFKKGKVQISIKKPS